MGTAADPLRQGPSHAPTARLPVPSLPAQHRQCNWIEGRNLSRFVTHPLILRKPSPHPGHGPDFPPLACVHLHVGLSPTNPMLAALRTNHQEEKPDLVVLTIGSLLFLSPLIELLEVRHRTTTIDAHPLLLLLFSSSIDYPLGSRPGWIPTSFHLPSDRPIPVPPRVVSGADGVAAGQPHAHHGRAPAHGT